MRTIRTNFLMLMLACACHATPTLTVLEWSNLNTVHWRDGGDWIELENTPAPQPFTEELREMLLVPLEPGTITRLVFSIDGGQPYFISWCPLVTDRPTWLQWGEGEIAPAAAVVAEPETLWALVAIALSFLLWRRVQA